MMRTQHAAWTCLQLVFFWTNTGTLGQTQTHNTPEASKYQHGFPHPDTRTAATSDPEPPGNTSLRAGLHQPATPQNTSSAFSSSNSMLLTRIKSRPRISSITLVATSGQTFRKNTHSPSGSSPNNSVFATNTNASERKLPAESAPQTSNIGAAGFMAIIACVVLFVGLMHFKVWDEIKRRRPEAVWVGFKQNRYVSKVLTLFSFRKKECVFLLEPGNGHRPLISENHHKAVVPGRFDSVDADRRVAEVV